MARLLVLAIAVVAIAASATAWFHAGKKQNQLIVTYSILPDPFHKRSFFALPRTLKEANAGVDYWTPTVERPRDNTTIYCREGDWRVCLLFDVQGSVAGIRLSVDRDEIQASGLNLERVPEWADKWSSLRHGSVYSATVYFQSSEELAAGGRSLKKDDLTAPNGIYILHTDNVGFETDRLHVPTQESEAASAGFTEQSCFFGMGKHYFQGLSKDSKCEDHRPYFLLYGPKTKELNGFGFVQYGNATTNGRGWFEHPSAKVAKKIAPNSPACLEDWVEKYGLFSLHVYFVSDPFWTFC
ncbi:uncharacterized protein LOC117650395 [Thrips palmi]|uniref:Uncharacterized protein LOC117650395 n=1 Tax=Thrips palmi TaxID=161013 RepID=A0A6P8ZX19_THRPL|nr:uncharacterized protein LOC117650395 [Thrips palmi]